MVERRVVEVSVTFAVELGRVRVPFAVEMIERKVVGVLVISPVELGLVAKTWALDVEANVDESVQFSVELWSVAMPCAVDVVERSVDVSV